MSRKLAICLCAWFVITGCKREGSDTSATDTTTSSSSATVSSTRTQDTTKTSVEIQVRGTAAFVEQADPQHPVAVILPKVGPQPDGSPEHVPYVAWLPDAEQDLKGSAQPVQDPKGGVWHFHRLDREELVLATTPAQNPVLTAPKPGGTCNPAPGSNDLPCIPEVADLASGSHPYNEAYVRANDPAPEVAARVELSNGTLRAVVNDACKWEMTKAGSSSATQSYLASRIDHVHDIVGATLKLQLRKLDKPYAVTDLVTLKPSGADNKITLRFGNAMSVFPDGNHEIKNGQTDPHFDVYYNFLKDVKDRPILTRTTVCSGGGSMDEVVYCGPAWISAPVSNPSQ
jgi:hypothetical protein